MLRPSSSLSVALLSVHLPGCHRIDAVEEEDGASPGETAAACNGALSSEPTALAEVGYDVELIADGDTLLVVEAGQYGRVRRLDRCTGEKLARRDIPFLADAVLHRGQLFFTGISEGPLTCLERWDELTDQMVQLAVVPFSRLFSHSSGLYLTHLVDGASVEQGQREHAAAPALASRRLGERARARNGWCAPRRRARRAHLRRS